VTRTTAAAEGSAAALRFSDIFGSAMAVVPYAPTILNFPPPRQLLAPLLWKVGGPVDWLGRFSATIFYFRIGPLIPR